MKFIDYSIENKEKFCIFRSMKINIISVKAMLSFFVNMQ